MNKEQHRYDLSFVSSNDALRTFPEIVFTINKGHLPEILERLIHTTKYNYAQENQYFNDPKTHFILPFQDLFGNMEFGYDSCGYCLDEEEQTEFHIEIITDKSWYCALTINILCGVLSVPFKNNCSDTKTQQLLL